MPRDRRPLLCLTILERDAGRRLDQLLVERLSTHLAPDAVSRKRVKALLDRGGVHLDGRRHRLAAHRVTPGQRVEVFADREALTGAREVAAVWELTAERILYEDDDLIAIDKPPGVRTQGTVADANDNLFEAARRFLHAREGAGEASYVALHHRLDRFASGIVLMARSRRANAGVAALFRERTADKRYRALCWPPPAGTPLPDAPWTMKGPLRRPGPVGSRDDGRFAHSECEILSVHPGVIECQVHPVTGRRHQVRLHLAMSHLPILGDRRYAPPGAPDGVIVERLMLHAWQLAFDHPITGRRVELVSPIPDDMRAVLGA